VVAAVVRPSDSPNGRRYTEADREAAYLLWRTSGRSLRRVAESLAVAASTVGTWSQAGGWVARAEREDAEEAESVRASIRGTALPRALKAIAFAERVMDDDRAPYRDRLAAAFWLAGIAGIAPVKLAQAQVAVAATVAASPAPAPDAFAMPTSTQPRSAEEQRAAGDRLTARVVGLDVETYRRIVALPPDRLKELLASAEPSLPPRPEPSGG
jgi:hypothetical protein